MGRNIRCVDTICDGCHVVFQRDSREFNRSVKNKTKQYCSRTCFQASNCHQVNVQCANCNTSVMRKRSDVKKSKNSFCSRSCSISYSNKSRVGELHPSYKEVPGAYNYRERALDFYGAFCAICGYDTKAALHVHHIDENRNNNLLANLIVLCPTHHVEVHLGLSKLPSNNKDLCRG